MITESLFDAHMRTVKDLATRAAAARHNGDESSALDHTRYCDRIINLYSGEQRVNLRTAFNEAYRQESGSYQMPRL